ncbi:MAG: aldose 1-epimerase family protein [Oscillospiraceae bacterium]
MQYTIKNTFLSMTIDTLGAQMISVKNNLGNELLWQGDNQLWADHAPILFPYAGRIKDGKFSVDGTCYPAPVHGFIRNVEHTLTLQENNMLTFEYTQNSDGRKLFPFDFSFKTSYILSGHSVHQKVYVKNVGRRSFGFGLGFHPGFNVPFDEKHTASDYFLEFDTPQRPFSLCTDGDVLMNGKYSIYGDNVKKIPLEDDFLKGESLILSNLTAKFVSIVERGTGRRIEFNIQHFPYLVVWTAHCPTMKFLCIEPWLTLPDSSDAPMEWKEKKHFKTLEPSGEFYILNRMKITV